MAELTIYSSNCNGVVRVVRAFRVISKDPTDSCVHIRPLESKVIDKNAYDLVVEKKQPSVQILNYSDIWIVWVVGWFTLWV